MVSAAGVGGDRHRRPPWPHRAYLTSLRRQLTLCGRSRNCAGAGPKGEVPGPMAGARASGFLRRVPAPATTGWTAGDKALFHRVLSARNQPTQKDCNAPKNRCRVTKQGYNRRSRTESPPTTRAVLRRPSRGRQSTRSSPPVSLELQPPRRGHGHG